MLVDHTWLVLFRAYYTGAYIYSSDNTAYIVFVLYPFVIQSEVISLTLGQGVGIHNVLLER